MLFAAMQARDPATGRHCNRVVALSVALARACGLAGCFDALYGFEDAGYVPKPEAAAFAAVFELDGLRPARAAMFEDDHRNLAVPHGLGLRTVLVGPRAGEAEHPHVHHRTDDLAGFLALLA